MIAGEDIRDGDFLRFCRADGMVYRFRHNPRQRRKRWVPSGIALSEAEFGERLLFQVVPPRAFIICPELLHNKHAEDTTKEDSP